VMPRCPRFAAGVRSLTGVRLPRAPVLGAY